MLGSNSPAVSDHAHSLRLGHAVELCGFLEVLLAANALRVAESGFGERINIAPGYEMVSTKMMPARLEDTTYFRRFQSTAAQEPCPARFPSHSCG